MLIGENTSDMDKDIEIMVQMTDRRWYTYEYEFDNGEVYQEEDCRMDNYIVFNSDNTFEQVLGDVDCEKPEKAKKGTWEIVRKEGKTFVRRNDNDGTVVDVEFIGGEYDVFSELEARFYLENGASFITRLIGVFN